LISSQSKIKLIKYSREGIVNFKENIKQEANSMAGSGGFESSAKSSTI
jgi:hypothetical protein